MSLLLFDGFEFAPALRNAMTVPTGTPGFTTGRDGLGKALTNTSQSAFVFVPLPGNLATLIMGVGFNIANVFALGSAGAGKGFTIYGDAGGTAHLSINFAQDGKVTLRRGSVGSTVIATSVNAVTSPAWHFMEVKVTIADAGGTCVIKVDGVESINFTGDTKNGGTLSSVSSLELPASNYIYIDDLYVCDTTGSAPYNDFLGDRVVRAVRPDGNGASSQWVGSDGNSTDNYLLVDDDPWSTADYVASATPAQRDLYDFAALSGMATVDAVQVVAQASKSDAGARSIKTVMRNSGGTILAGADLPLSTTYGAVQDAVSLTDAAATAWTQAKVNSHQFGIEVV